jgi:membrane protease YdiL (CAAX protease family)
VEGARAAGDALKGARSPVAEAITAWVVVIGGLALIQLAGRWFPPLRGLVGALAVAGFLYVPLRLLERAGQDAHDAGWRFDRMGRDLAWSLGVCVVVLPLFAVGFVHFWKWAAHLPHEWRSLLAPDSRDRPFHFRMPPINFDFLGQVAGNAAVAFSEEFFYRGYMTLRFGERWRPLPTALAAATFFALGHLLTPSPFRLAVFFPALLFAFLRQRTGTIVGAAIAHFLCNVWLIILEYSLY